MAEVLNAFAIKRPLRLMFQDEARFGRHQHLPLLLGEISAAPTVKAMLTHQYVCAGGAGWHRCQPMPIPDNIGLLYLPPYFPELNPVEHLGDDLREKHFHNHVFDSLDALEDQLVKGLPVLETNPQRVRSICNWA